VLCRLFGVTDENLDPRMGTAYAGLSAGGPTTSFHREPFAMT
jgi:hypothetical protein